MTHPIPTAALDDRLGFIGTSGSGKTYNAGGAIERLLRRKARIVIVDPLGVWWGLRLLADGKKPSPYPVAIFGGAHGDLPLNEHAGALIGETAATMAESCIVDLSQLGTKSAERRFMTAFLETIYRKANGEPVHLVVDEADLFAPQKPPKGDETLLNLMEQIVRRGRIKGFIPWLISQRPAVLNKNVLSQVDGLIAFKLTASQDRDALDGWIEGQADKAQGKAIKDALPAMQVGQGIVWVPGRGVLSTVAFPPKETFDSSRTPKRGQKLERAAALKPLDLGALKDRLATIEAEVKANDPKELKAEIARLQRELLTLKSTAHASDPAAIAAAEQRGHARGYSLGKVDGYANAVTGVGSELGAVVAAIDNASVAFENIRIVAAQVQNLANHALKNPPKTARDIPENIPDRIPVYVTSRAPVPRSVSGGPPQSPSQVKPVTPFSGNGASDRPLGAERKPLAVLAGVHPDGMTEAQWAVASGLKRSGGTWSTYLSRLKAAGRVERQGNLYVVSEQGLAEIGEAAAAVPPRGPELVAFWAQRIPGAGPMLRRLAEIYPQFVTREDLAQDLDLSATGGTFSTYLSRLRAPGLIEEDNEKRVRAATELMGG